MDVTSLVVTTVLTIKIYRLERSHEKEREQMEVKAQEKAIAEAARVFLIDNEDEIEYEVTRQDATRCIIQTYICLGDILSLQDE